MRKINVETYLKKKKNKKKSMEKADTTVCLNKKTLKEYQKNYREARMSQYNNE